jgi:hypothetical protein
VDSDVLSTPDLGAAAMRTERGPRHDGGEGNVDSDVLSTPDLGAAAMRTERGARTRDLGGAATRAERGQRSHEGEFGGAATREERGQRRDEGGVRAAASRGRHDPTLRREGSSVARAPGGVQRREGATTRRVISAVIGETISVMSGRVRGNGRTAAR